MTTLIAIDPGQNGGIAIRHHDGSVTACTIPATVRDFIDLLTEIVRNHYLDDTSIPIVIMEDVPPYTGKAQSGSSAFKFGRNIGQLEGVIQCLQLRFEKVRPQKWQKALSLGTSKGMSRTDWKNKLKTRAQELRPELKITLATSDAVLILEWWIAMKLSDNLSQIKLAQTMELV